MFGSIHKFIQTIGYYNLCALFISILVTVYALYKSFYRFVYSSSTICKSGRLNDQTNNFTSRILIYNNGKKTIEKTNVRQFSISSTYGIKSVRLLQTSGDIKVRLKDSKVTVTFNHLDSSKYFVLEVEHTGHLNVNARISETGEILHTEPKFWIVVNILFVLLFALPLFYNAIHLFEADKSLLGFKNMIFVVTGLIILRTIHRAFFIPDYISSRYLNTTDKLNRQFNNVF